MNADMLVMLGLTLIMGMVLVLPFTSHRIEENLESFLLAMGLLTVSASGG